MIRLEDFPHPKDDNGRGIHWSPSPYHLPGSELDYWLNELLAMDMKWVKVMDDGGGSSLELCRRLVDIDIMPVVRMMIGNPGHVQTRNLEAIRKLLDVGAMYFETNNEPDLAVEWEDGIVPSNWLQIVVDNFIIDATAIIELGGYPAFPAMGVGTIVNPFDLIVQRGRQDLFDNGAWLAIHNYIINHPLDYPYDSVNQTGKQLTEAEYQATRWQWDTDPLSVINRLRTEGVHPGATIHDDATCWLAYTLWNEQIISAFGHSVPIMSTEGGVVVGDRQDGRYGRNDAARHEEVTLWVQDFLLTGAPTWYFTVFHWLIANRLMGQDRPGWETQCWYTNWWDKEFGLSGRLPTVDALKITPSRIRSDATADAVIEGRLTGNGTQVANGRRMYASVDGEVIRETESRSDGFFRFVGLPPNTYAITIDGVLGMLAYGLGMVSHSRITAQLQLPGPLSAVGGKVTDEEGTPGPMQTVVIKQDGTRIASTVTDWQGNYAFGVLAASSYTVELPDLTPVTVDLDGQSPVTVNMVIPAGRDYTFRVITKRLLPQSESLGRHAFFGYVRNEVGDPIDGVKIEMSWTDAEAGTVFPTTLSGSDAGRARGYFEFVHTRGEFQLSLLDVPWPAQTADGLKTTGLPGQGIDESVSYEIVWQLIRAGNEPAQSSISGTLVGGSEGLNVALVSGDLIVVSVALRADGSFRFSDLAAGTYDLDVNGAGVVQSGIVVDGISAVNLLPIDITWAKRGVISGTVKDLAGNPRSSVDVRLLFANRLIAQMTTDSSGQYRFDKLLRGTYFVETVKPFAQSSGIAITGDYPVVVDLHVPDPVVESRPLTHYLLFGPRSTAGTVANFRAARKYIIGAGVSAGFDAGEASQAARVTIIGGEDAVSTETEDWLLHAGCEVGRITGDTYDVAASLARLLERVE